MTFVRKIEFFPAWDRRDKNPSKNYGVHGVDCLFSVSKNGKGITFELYTNWYLPHVQQSYSEQRPPQGAFVSYHDNKPHYEEQSCREECNITGGKCYSDGSGLLADDFFKILVAEGSEGLFKKMEETYVEWLEGEQ